MAKKSLDQCKTGDDFVKYAKKRALDVRNCKSSHVVVTGTDGKEVIPRGNKQLGKGLASHLRKSLPAIGILIILLGCSLAAFVQMHAPH